MLRSMDSAAGALRAMQQLVDTTANNIANVNTTGFKASRVSFADALSQTLSGAAGPTDALGSVNAQQLGLGVTVGGIQVSHTQGGLTNTGRQTDLAIEGQGFFVVSDGTRDWYTRDGGFSIDATGKLVNSSGMRVQGWTADDAGVINPAALTGDVVIPVGQKATAQGTTKGTVRGNLDAGVADGTVVDTTMSIYDSLGIAHAITISLTKNGPDTWDWTATADPNDAAIAGLVFTPGIPDQATFSENGAYNGAIPGGNIAVTFTNGAANQSVDVGLENLTQFGKASDVSTLVDGFGAGELVSFTISDGGQIVGIFTNGQSKLLAQVALAAFDNPEGLIKQGDNLYGNSPASGDPRVGLPTTGGRGNIAAGTLEGSNVDLANEFTKLITGQRAFQANSRVITTSDEMLSDLVNLKR